MLVNFGGWPAVPRRAKVSCCAGARAGLGTAVTPRQGHRWAPCRPEVLPEDQCLGKEQELARSPCGEQGAGSPAAAGDTPCQITFRCKCAFAPGPGRGRGGGRAEGGGGGRSAPGWGGQPGPGTPCRCEPAGDGAPPAEPGRTAGLVLYFTFYLSPDPLPGRSARGAAGGFPSRLGCGWRGGSAAELPLSAPRHRIAGTAPLCAGRCGRARAEGPGQPGPAWSSAWSSAGHRLLRRQR